MKSRLTKISTIALTAATAVLTMGFASICAAEESPVPAGIEVITVTAKRIDPAIASTCVDAALAQAQAASIPQQDAAANTPAGTVAGKLQFRRSVRDCIEQSSAAARS